MGTGFGFLAREAWLNCRRQPLLLLACFSTTAIALTTLGAFALLAWNVHRMAEDIPRRFEVHAFLRVGAPPGQAQRLVGKLQALPGVRQVRLVPRAAAWARYQARYPYKQDLEGFSDNPLPDKLEIATVSPNVTLSLAEELRTWSQFDHVNEGRAALRRLLTITGVVRLIGIALSVLLALGTCAIVGNTIRLTLFARRREIRVMQLVGATPGFIRMPFFLEGLSQGALGGIAAAALSYGGLRYLEERVLPEAPFVRELQLAVDVPWFCLSLMVGGALLGSLGALVSLHRFLRAA